MCSDPRDLPSAEGSVMKQWRWEVLRLADRAARCAFPTLPTLYPRGLDPRDDASRDGSYRTIQAVRGKCAEQFRL
jgi:hypothetical protein